MVYLVSRWSWCIIAVTSALGSIAACGGDASAPPATRLIVNSTSATFLWEPPTTRSNGEVLSPDEIAGYKVYCSNQAGTDFYVVDVGFVTSYTVTALTHGIYYFNVTAYDRFDQESNPSNMMTVTVN